MMISKPTPCQHSGGYAPRLLHLGSTTIGTPLQKFLPTPLTFVTRSVILLLNAVAKLVHRKFYEFVN